MRMMIRKVVTEMGHTVVAEAGNGKDAVLLYRQHKPDIVTMDITMPVMTGLEAVKYIHEENCLARIIMITSIGQKSIVTEALKEGASDFIVKPFESEQLMNIFNKTLDREQGGKI
jgi:two-component system chemotaxis response regulator CheY